MNETKMADEHGTVPMCITHEYDGIPIENRSNSIWFQAFLGGPQGSSANSATVEVDDDAVALDFIYTTCWLTVPSTNLINLHSEWRGFNSLKPIVNPTLTCNVSGC